MKASKLAFDFSIFSKMFKMLLLLRNKKITKKPHTVDCQFTKLHFTNCKLLQSKMSLMSLDGATLFDMVN